MSRAYLTIDDGPTKHTPKLMDFLCSRGIVPVMNFIGEQIARYPDEAAYAIKRGAVIGNHSRTHERFSTLTLEACRSEIRDTEALIDGAHSRAGVKRAHRAFRFPYGDKGRANAGRIQAMLRDEFRFERLDDSGVAFPWWKEHHLDADVDMFWTFDFVEYRLPWHDGYTWDCIMKRIADKEPETGGSLIGDQAMNIILIHDSEETAAFRPDYFETLIDCVLEQKVLFLEPVFVACP